MQNKINQKRSVEELTRDLQTKTRFQALTQDEIAKIICVSTEMRKGHKRAKGCPFFWVKVDGVFEKVHSNHALRQFINCCSKCDRNHFRMFRNADKGITIKLEA